MAHLLFSPSNGPMNIPIVQSLSWGTTMLRPCNPFRDHGSAECNRSLAQTHRCSQIAKNIKGREVARSTTAELFGDTGLIFFCSLGFLFSVGVLIPRSQKMMKMRDGGSAPNGGWGRGTAGRSAGPPENRERRSRRRHRRGEGRGTASPNGMVGPQSRCGDNRGGDNTCCFCCHKPGRRADRRDHLKDHYKVS